MKCVGLSSCGLLVRVAVRADAAVDSVVFFFQAEDGIRDGRVTGVQTCALPISSMIWEVIAAVPAPCSLRLRPATSPALGSRRSTGVMASGRGGRYPRRVTTDGKMRSEERRVGKEGRDWGGADYLKKKKIGDKVT